MYMCVVANLKDNNESKAGCQNGPELLGQFIWCAGPGRLSVVFISENMIIFTTYLKIFVMMSILHSP